MPSHPAPKLNDEQQAAVEHVNGPMLVIAGAGSGKTRVVTRRIVRLIEKGISPDAILGLTFTNKAAKEMQERVQQSIHSRVLICTFHSLGARILRESISAMGYQSHFAIYDEDDAEKVVKGCINDLGLEKADIDTKGLRQLISNAKNAMQTPEQLANVQGNTPTETHFPKFYAMYQKRLRDYNAVDFDDLLFLTVKLLQNHPEVLAKYHRRWQYLLIDEYQDTNESQYTMVKLLVGDTHNLCVVGDPDQSIYSWRGANIQNILNFEKDYANAKVVRLEQNYRSRSNILEAANALIAHNTSRYEKNLWSDLGAGAKIQLHQLEGDRDEVRMVMDAINKHQRQGISLNEMVIFYRTNSQSRIFEDALLSNRLPYTIVGGISFYQRREIKDILGYLRMIQSSHDYVSFERTVNTPKRGLGPSTIDKLRDGASETGVPILDYCEQMLKADSADGYLKLSAKQKNALMQYVNVIVDLRARRNQLSLKELVEAVIGQTGYGLYIDEDQETAEDRWENMRELVSTAAEWEVLHPEGTLGEFLEELSLKSSLDVVDDSEAHVSLMTLHNGKGLEFAVTFLVGLEEELFPHVNSRASPEALEEERRLCYVGMTRAKEFLYISSVKTRLLWGTLRRMRPSRFLREIPEKYVEQIGGMKSRWERERVERQEELHVAPLPMSAPHEADEPFAIGELVFHREFGVGKVESVYDSSAGLTYRVFFTKDQNEKSLVAKFAKLSRL